MPIILLILGSLVAADVFVWWTGSRSLCKLRSHRVIRYAFHGFLFLQTASLTGIVLSWSQHFNIDTFLPKPLAIVVFVWHLVVVPLALAGNLVGLVVESVTAVVRRFGSKASPSLPPASDPGLTRREFLIATAALTPPALTLALSAVAAHQLEDFRIRLMTISVAGLPAELDGLTIAHVSDTHIGRFTHGSVTRKIVEATNALNAELVLFTGDLINDSLGWLPQGIEMLRGIRAPLVLCEGNHDLIENGREFVRQVKASGLTLLVNEAITLKVRGIPVQFLGLRWGGPPAEGQRLHDEHGIESSAAELLKLRDPSAFPIVLAHHPHAWDHFGDLPLVLSGHTHGGQLMLNERLGFGPVMFRYWSGLYTRRTNPGNTLQTLVVSNGVGNWFPLRTEAPAEIIHLTLRRA